MTKCRWAWGTLLIDWISTVYTLQILSSLSSEFRAWKLLAPNCTDSKGRTSCLPWPTVRHPSWPRNNHRTVLRFKWRKPGLHWNFLDSVYFNSKYSSFLECSSSLGLGACIDDIVNDKTYCETKTLAFGERAPWNRKDPVREPLLFLIGRWWWQHSDSVGKAKFV